MIQLICFRLQQLAMPFYTIYIVTFVVYILLTACSSQILMKFSSVYYALQTAQCFFGPNSQLAKIDHYIQFSHLQYNDRSREGPMVPFGKDLNLSLFG